MNVSTEYANPAADQAAGPPLFQATVNGQPLLLDSLLGSLSPRPELDKPPRHWTWKVIGEGRVARKRASIGLYLDHDLEPGSYDLVNERRISIVYNQSPHCRSIIYHSKNFQTGTLILTEADLDGRRLAGQFSFTVSATDFAVNDGRFELYCDCPAAQA